MKRIMLPIAVIAVFFISCAQNDVVSADIPSVVLNSFKNKYQNTQDVEWEKKNDNYEVEFEIKQNDYTALISKEGKILKYKEDIKKEEIPSLVSSFIEDNYKDEKLDDIEKITIGNDEYYQIEFEGTFKDKEIVVTSEGSLATDVSVWR